MGCKVMKQTERKHLAIIEAAKAEFIEHGFVAANMDRISLVAEVSKRTLYRHFDSKETLFISVLRIIQESVNENVQYQFDPEKPLKSQLIEITRHEVDVLYNTYGMSLSRIIVMEFIRQPELAKNLVKDLYSTNAIAEWFKLAIEAKAIVDKDVSLLTNIYSSLFQGLFFWPQMMELAPLCEGEKVEKNINTVVDVFLTSFALKK